MMETLFGVVFRCDPYEQHAWNKISCAAVRRYCERQDNKVQGKSDNRDTYGVDIRQNQRDVICSASCWLIGLKVPSVL